MRIIAGKLKGFTLHIPKDKITRPLKDIARESIFNLLTHSNKILLQLKQSNVLDLYAGTGSFGLECLSRGAAKVIFFENYRKSLEILKKNINQLNLYSKSEIIEENAYNINKINMINKNFDLIFLDPPFKDKRINELIIEIKKLKIASNQSLIIIHRNKKIEEKISNDLKILREKNYGLSKIIFGKIS